MTGTVRFGGVRINDLLEGEGGDSGVGWWTIVKSRRGAWVGSLDLGGVVTGRRGGLRSRLVRFFGGLGRESSIVRL